MRSFGAFLAGAVADPFPRPRGPFPAAGKDFHPPTAKRVFFPALRCECAPNPPSEPVRQLLSPPLAGGDKGEGEMRNLRNIRILLHPHPRPPPSEAVSQCHFEAAPEKS
jgi:hypothetical protein